MSASNDLSALADGVLRAAEGPGAAFFAWGGEAAASSSPTLNGASFGSTLLSIECGHDYMGVSCGSSNGARTTTGGGDRRRRQTNDGERRTPPRSASFCFLYTGCIGKALSPWVPFFLLQLVRVCVHLAAAFGRTRYPEDSDLGVGAGLARQSVASTDSVLSPYLLLCGRGMKQAAAKRRCGGRGWNPCGRGGARGLRWCARGCGGDDVVLGRPGAQGEHQQQHRKRQEYFWRGISGTEAILCS